MENDVKIGADGGRGCLLARQLARNCLAATLTLSIVAACCATAHAAGYIQIVPVGVTSYVYPVDLSRLPGAPPPDITDRSYSAISTAGGLPKSVTVVSGYSLPELLQELDPGTSFTFAEVLEPDGRSLLLTNPQATSLTGEYSDGPPVVWQDGAGVHFLVPSLPGDDAYAGQAFTGQGETITVDLHSGALLSVGISSSAARVALDKAVRFRSKVVGAPPGTLLNYTWTFGDGNGASQASVSHHYIVAGTYDVYLRVTASNDSLGFSSVIPIEVGKAPKGPNRKGGGTSKSKKAPTNGAGTRGTGNTKNPSKKTTTTTMPPGPTTTAPAPRGLGEHLRSHQARALRALGPARPLLSGIALSGASRSPDRATPTSVRAAGVTDPARTGHLATGHHVSGEGIWIALSTLALVFGGALLEWKGRPRFRRLPSSA